MGRQIPVDDSGELVIRAAAAWPGPAASVTTAGVDTEGYRRVTFTARFVGGNAGATPITAFTVSFETRRKGGAAGAWRPILYEEPSGTPGLTTSTPYSTIDATIPTGTGAELERAYTVLVQHGDELRATFEATGGPPDDDVEILATRWGRV